MLTLAKLPFHLELCKFFKRKNWAQFELDLTMKNGSNQGDAKQTKTNKIPSSKLEGIRKSFTFKRLKLEVNSNLYRVSTFEKKRKQHVGSWKVPLFEVPFSFTPLHSALFPVKITVALSKRLWWRRSIAASQPQVKSQHDCSSEARSVEREHHMTRCCRSYSLPELTNRP